jgi:hypothetical protein
MCTAYLVVSLIAAAMVGASASGTLLRVKFVTQSFTDYGVPRSWWPWLGTAKAAGALGLVTGLFVPIIGEIAAICLVGYFIGAVVTVIRARFYTHIPVPLFYAGPVIAALALGWVTGWPVMLG